MVFIVTLMSIGMAGCLGGEEKLYIYHAGSLSVPFEELEERFEEAHPGIDVMRESGGSVATVRKVTDYGKEPDVVAVADYSLIPDLMYPDYADWTVMFARNRMIIAYTNDSRYADEINQENWYEILQRDGVKFGFSNPNDDPCGYRSQMVILLAEDYYDDGMIFENLVERNTAIEADGYNITVPSSQELDIDTTKVMVRSMEVELMSALQVGEIDYLFIYQSVAQQHGVEFLQLPEEIDLSSVDHADRYAMVNLTRGTGETVSGKPIVYGVTIPKTVRNWEMAVAFVEFLLSEEGLSVMDSMGQPPISPPKTDNLSAMPEELRDLVEQGWNE